MLKARRPQRQVKAILEGMTFDPSKTLGEAFGVTRSKIPLNKWLLATHLMTSSKKGISSHRVHRNLGVTYKTAWFMTHRIREAMKDTATDQLGGPDGSGIVEADEIYLGRTRGKGKGAHVSKKQQVVALVERKSCVPVPTTSRTLRPRR